MNIPMPGQPNRPSIAQMAAWGIDMRRDDELIRKYLIELQDDPEWLVFCLPTDGNDDDDVRRKYYHLRLLADAGFLQESGRHGGVFRITNDGHDFVAFMRDDTWWGRIKAKAAETMPGAALRFMFELGCEMLRQKAREKGYLS